METETKGVKFMISLKDITDLAVASYAEDRDCSMLDARHDLRCEAIAASTGAEVDYSIDSAAALSHFLDRVNS
jgi:hypothetical protein